jgi:hypothetical protein
VEEVTVLRLRDSDLEWKEIDEEIVALDAARSTYVSIEGAGVPLWHALETGATREDLVTLLVDRYGIDAERAGQDVDGFLDGLRERDLLQR